jgi:hypothetical protein
MFHPFRGSLPSALVPYIAILAAQVWVEWTCSAPPAGTNHESEKFSCFSRLLFSCCNQLGLELIRDADKIAQLTGTQWKPIPLPLLHDSTDHYEISPRRKTSLRLESCHHHNCIHAAIDGGLLSPTHPYKYWDRVILYLFIPLLLSCSSFARARKSLVSHSVTGRPGLSSQPSAFCSWLPSFITWDSGDASMQEYYKPHTVGLPVDHLPRPDRLGIPLPRLDPVWLRAQVRAGSVVAAGRPVCIDAQSASPKWRRFPRSSAALPLAGSPIGRSLSSGPS